MLGWRLELPKLVALRERCAGEDAMKFGHGFWTVVALQVFRWKDADGHDLCETRILQRCKDCGKIRQVTFDGDWADYADGIYGA